MSPKPAKNLIFKIRIMIQGYSQRMKCNDVLKFFSYEKLKVEFVPIDE